MDWSVSLVPQVLSRPTLPRGMRVRRSLGAVANMASLQPIRPPTRMGQQPTIFHHFWRKFPYDSMSSIMLYNRFPTFHTYFRKIKHHADDPRTFWSGRWDTRPGEPDMEFPEAPPEQPPEPPEPGGKQFLDEGMDCYSCIVKLYILPCNTYILPYIILIVYYI